MKVSLSKSDMAKLHDSGKVEKDGVEIQISGINHSITPDAWITKLDTLSKHQKPHMNGRLKTASLKNKLV